MNETTFAIFGIASGVVNTIALVPYLRDIFRHKTQPERAAWWIFFILALIAFGAQVAAGARWSLVFAVSGLIGTGAIAVLSIPYGYGTFERRDTISLTIGGVGVIVSLALRSPLLALLVVIGVDLVGTWLIVVKTWEAPYSETLSTWILTIVSASFALLSIGSYTLARYLDPLYLLVINFLVMIVIVVRRRTVSNTK